MTVVDYQTRRMEIAWELAKILMPPTELAQHKELVSLFQSLRGVALMPVYTERPSDHPVPSNAYVGPSIDHVSDSDQSLHADIKPKSYSGILAWDTRERRIDALKAEEWRNHKR